MYDIERKKAKEANPDGDGAGENGTVPATPSKRKRAPAKKKGAEVKEEDGDDGDGAAVEPTPTKRKRTPKKKQEAEANGEAANGDNAGPTPTKAKRAPRKKKGGAAAGTGSPIKSEATVKDEPAEDDGGRANTPNLYPGDEDPVDEDEPTTNGNAEEQGELA